jgi:DNA topoisomerase-1
MPMKALTDTLAEGPGIGLELPPELHYVDDSLPGIRRRKLRGRFAYFLPDGTRITDADEIQRINHLAIPPAYQDVWICMDPCGHLQATGRDARGRKQYRYHPDWRELRDGNKYERMLAFGAALPRLRARVDKDLQGRELSRERVVATVVALLDNTLIRVGNQRYAKQNKSYGLTTLRTRHVQLQGSTIRFQFRGKSGVEHKVTLRNAGLARIMRRCLELPGQQLFQYLDDDGQRHPISSSDINAYLREVTGADFTAKDYRTWAGSCLALARLRACREPTSSQGKSHLLDTVREVARQLGNTPAVCRRCYIHPAVLEHFAEDRLGAIPRCRKSKWLSVEEVALCRFLKNCQSAC